MFKKIKEFFVGKPVDVVALGAAPYKIPEPTATPPIPLVAEAAPIVVEVIISETTVAPVVIETPAPVIEADSTKKTRKPRTPKVETAVEEKAPAKAKAPKLTVIKATKSKKV